MWVIPVLGHALCPCACASPVSLLWVTRCPRSCREVTPRWAPAARLCTCSTALRVPVVLSHPDLCPLRHSSPSLTPAGPAGAHPCSHFILVPLQGFLGDPGAAGDKGEKGVKVRVAVPAPHSPARVGRGLSFPTTAPQPQLLLSSITQAALGFSRG